MIVLLIEILCIAILGMILSTAIVDEWRNRSRSIRLVKLNGCWDGDDRRVTERLNLALGVKYYLNGKSADAKSVDVSTKGIRLILEEKFEKGTPLRFEIKLPDNKHIVKARGVVVWSGESEESKKNSVKRFFNTGIKFSKFQGNDEKILFDFIYSNLTPEKQ